MKITHSECLPVDWWSIAYAHVSNDTTVRHLYCFSRLTAQSTLSINKHDALGDARLAQFTFAIICKCQM